MVTIHEEAREETYKQILHVNEELHSWKEAPVFFCWKLYAFVVWTRLWFIYFRLNWQKTVRLYIRYHVGGDDITEGYSKMGEITWEKHLLLRWAGNDGSPERSILPDLISHHWNLLSVLRLWVSACYWWLLQTSSTLPATRLKPSELSTLHARDVSVGSSFCRVDCLFNAIVIMGGK